MRENRLVEVLGVVGNTVDALRGELHAKTKQIEELSEEDRIDLQEG